MACFTLTTFSSHLLMVKLWMSMIILRYIKDEQPRRAERTAWTPHVGRHLTAGRHI